MENEEKMEVEENNGEKNKAEGLVVVNTKEHGKPEDNDPEQEIPQAPTGIDHVPITWGQIIEALEREYKDPALMNSIKTKLEDLRVAVGKHLRFTEDEIGILNGGHILQFFTEIGSYGPFIGSLKFVGAKLKEILSAPSSFSIQPPTVPKPVVQWNFDDVVEWALARVDEKHAQKLHEQEVSGKTLLNWSKQDEKTIEERLRSYGVAGGPASDLASDIKKLSGHEPTGPTPIQGPLQWKKPKRLLDTSGKDWKYQPGTELWGQLKNSLSEHYQSWQNEATDKQMHPAYFLFSGPGTGKSRTLDEFQELCIEATQENPELSERLKKAYVFKVNFENGTSVIQFENGGHEIGTRMLFQLAGGGSDYQSFSSRNKVAPGQVLEWLAQGEKVDARHMTVLILVDGTHVLPHMDGDRSSKMKQAIDSIVDLINAGPYFCIGVFAATSYTPLEQTLNKSPQLRISLVPPVIDGRVIIPSNDPLVNIFIDDMGGHGRALEKLMETMKEIDIKTCSASGFMNIVKSKMELAYPPLTSASTHLVPALIAVLTRRQLVLKEKIPGMDTTVEGLISLGLFRWKRINIVNGHLECPFILLWLLATWSRDPVLSHFKLEAYDEQQSQTNPGLPKGLQMWQNWEETTAQFRILKSALLDGQVVPLSTLHAGALMGSDCSKIQVKVHKINVMIRASHQYDTKPQGNRAMKIVHESGMVDLKEESVFVINATSAPAADGFCTLEIIGEEAKDTRELHQNKRIQNIFSSDDYMEEHQKAAREKDVFIVFTTGDSTVIATELPSRGMIVSKTNFKDYFGPFAARAFHPIKVDINQATRSQLEAINGIGEKTAKRILEERNDNGNFNDRDDFKKRLKMDRTLSEAFVFPN